jgi:hypothetical protein
MINVITQNSELRFSSINIQINYTFYHQRSDSFIDDYLAKTMSDQINNITQSGAAKQYLILRWRGGVQARVFVKFNFQLPLLGMLMITSMQYSQRPPINDLRSLLQGAF